MGFARDATGSTFLTTQAVSVGSPYALLKFAPNATGVPSPVASASLSNVTASQGEVALDGSGQVYVALNGEIAEFSSNLKMQIATLSGPKTDLTSTPSHISALTVDASGNLYVAMSPPGCCKGSILAFAPLVPGSNDVAPIRSLAATSDGLVTDQNGDVFTFGATSEFVTEYPAGLQGDAPVQFGLPNSYSVVGAGNIAVSGDHLFASSLQIGGNGLTPSSPVLFRFDIANPNAPPIPFISYDLTPKSEPSR